jgi:hypothetical protein
MTNTTRPTTVERARARTPDFHTLLVFRCPTTLSEALADRAHEYHTSVSAVIRELCRQGLQDDDRSAPHTTTETTR